MSALEPMLQRIPHWLAGPGEHDGIVVSSRVRLARNLAGWNFRRKLAKPRQSELVELLTDIIGRLTGWPDAGLIRLSGLGETERLALLERQLASRELAGSRHPAALCVSPDESLALMVNEEDHLRLQAIGPGLCLERELGHAVALDRELEQAVGWAVHPRLGYLTACHTNLGTGMRASVMLHLPALAETSELKPVVRALDRLHITVRGTHGEGSEPTGHWYQISNNRSLGLDEAAIAGGISEAAVRLVEAERQARNVLMERNPLAIEDKVWRAWGVLSNARTLTAAELADHLGWLRLGMALRVLQRPTWAILDQLTVHVLPGHIQVLHPLTDDPRQRDQLRARLVRTALAGG